MAEEGANAEDIELLRQQLISVFRNTILQMSHKEVLELALPSGNILTYISVAMSDWKEPYAGFISGVVRQDRQGQDLAD